MGTSDLWPRRTEVWVAWGPTACAWHLSGAAAWWDRARNLWGLFHLWLAAELN